MSSSITRATDFVTAAGHWQFMPVSADVVLVEHWPARPGKKAGYPRGSSLSTEAARRLYKTLLEQAL